MAVEDMLIVAVLLTGVFALSAFLVGQMRDPMALYAGEGVWLIGVILVLAGVAASACRFAGVL